ncbi:MAG: FixH family protein [Dysgonamonadaceae bacterium]|jgi:hypothetical protein|nr:FixH family protein [Dysgonamonadaceae bacterium]
MKAVLLYTLISLSVFIVSCERDYEPERLVNDEGTGTGNTTWIKSFTTGKTSYYLFFTSPRLEEGINTLRAVLYLENMKPVAGYTIAIDPRMPDMENHSSPNNQPLEWNAEKRIYEGTLNLTMTGWWRLNLQVYDDKGNLTGGNAVEGQGSSSLYWDIEI